MKTDTDVDLALETARAVANDSSAPAAARIQAARTLLEAAGKIGKNSAAPERETKPLNAMTQAELLAEIDRLRANPFGLSS